MTDASAVQPERPLGRDTERHVEHLVDVTAARVFTEPITVGEHVVMTAAVLGRVGDRHESRGRSIAVIDAGPDGVHLRPVFGAAKIALVALAAAAAVWCATRRA
jgi:hypothetical protein